MDGLMISNVDLSEDGIEFDDFARGSRGDVNISINNTVIDGANDGIDFSEVASSPRADNISVVLNNVRISNVLGDGIDMDDLGRDSATNLTVLINDTTITNTGQAGLQLEKTPGINGQVTLNNVTFAGEIGTDDPSQKTLLLFEGLDGAPLIVNNVSGTVTDQTTNSPSKCKGAFNGDLQVNSTTITTADCDPL